MIIRQKRMQGYDTLWLPGMDHAGIALKQKLKCRLREQFISRHDLGREILRKNVGMERGIYASPIHRQ